MKRGLGSIRISDSTDKGRRSISPVGVAILSYYKEVPYGYSQNRRTGHH